MSAPVAHAPWAGRHAAEAVLQPRVRMQHGARRVGGGGVGVVVIVVVVRKRKVKVKQRGNEVGAAVALADDAQRAQLRRRSARRRAGEGAARQGA